MPDNANMEVFSLRVFPMVSTRAIQFGAFRDLNATQSLVAISTQGIDTSTGTVASAREMFSMASVSPFQMMAFSTAPLSWIPLRPRLAPASTTSMGRMGPSVYAGGSLTVGGGSPLQLLRAVSAGKYDVGATYSDPTPNSTRISGCEGVLGKEVAKLSLVTVTDEVPNDVLVAAPDVKREKVELLRAAGKTAPNSEAGKDLLKAALLADGVAEVGDSDFDPIRKALDAFAR
jgi:hypothetical protein